MIMIIVMVVIMIEIEATANRCSLNSDLSKILEITQGAVYARVPFVS